MTGGGGKGINFGVRSSNKMIADGKKKNLREEKLKAFAAGRPAVITKSPYEKKKEEEEAKRKQAQREADAVYEDFVASFEGHDSSDEGRDGRSDNGKKSGLSFVHGGVMNDPSDAHMHSRKSTLDSGMYSERSHDHYSTSSSISNSTPARNRSSGALAVAVNDVLKKPSNSTNMKIGRRTKDKKPSNLELFMQEGMREVEQQEELKSQRASGTDSRRGRSYSSTIADDSSQTTNIFVGRLTHGWNESMLCSEFGVFGPLASVKVMWPRSQEEVNRTTFSAFVAFMNRKDAENAIRSMNQKSFFGLQLKTEWAKKVELPSVPCYVHHVATRSSVLPFNARVPSYDNRKSFSAVAPPEEHSRAGEKNDNDDISNAEIQVILPPLEVRVLIHRTVEFVIRHGPAFEALLISREKNNKRFSFLTDFLSEEHIYFRWRLYASLNGDSRTEWHMKRFRMYSGGPWWISPEPSSKIELTRARGRRQRDAERNMKSRGRLPIRERNELKDRLRRLTTANDAIGDTMVFCLTNSDAADEVIDCICEALAEPTAPPIAKTALFFLISDILHNSTASIRNASFYRLKFEKALPKIVADLNLTYRAIEGRMRAETFKKSIMTCFRAWADWFLYSPDYLASLSNVFIAIPKDDTTSMANAKQKGVTNISSTEDDDIDGVPIEDSEDIDGVPMNDEELAYYGLVEELPPLKRVKT